MLHSPSYNLRVDSIIFRRVLTPFCTACSFSGRFVCLCRGMHTDCETGGHFPYVCVRKAKVRLAFFSLFVIWIVHIYMALWINSNFKFALEQAMLTNWNIVFTIHHLLLSNNLGVDNIIWTIITDAFIGVQLLIGVHFVKYGFLPISRVQWPHKLEAAPFVLYIW